MTTIKRAHSPNFKAQVALDLIKEIETVSQICSRHGIHPTQAKKWKEAVLANLVPIFDKRPDTALAEKDQLIDDLYRQVGKLKVELDWLKKKTHSG